MATIASGTVARVSSPPVTGIATTAVGVAVGSMAGAGVAVAAGAG